MVAQNTLRTHEGNQVYSENNWCAYNTVYENARRMLKTELTPFLPMLKFNKIESQSQTASNLQFVKTMFVMIMFV